MSGRRRMCKENRYPTCIPVGNRCRVIVQRPTMRECSTKPGQVGLEVVSHERWGPSSLLHHGREGIKFGIMDLLEGAGVVGVERAIGQLKTLHCEAGGVERLHLGAGFEAQEHLAFELAVQGSSFLRQLDLDHVLDQRRQLQEVGRAHGDCEVAQCALDLLLGERQHRLLDQVLLVWRDLALVGEPPGLECRVAAAQPAAEVEEEGLAPEILQAVRRRGAGEVHPGLDLGARHLAQHLRPLAALRDAVALQPGGLVGDHDHERPLAALRLQLVAQPLQVVVVHREDLSRRGERGAALLGRAGDRHQPEPGEVLPLALLVRPCRLRHAQRRQDQGRAVFAQHVEQPVEPGQNADRLAHTHASPDVHPGVRGAGQVAQDRELVVAGGELTHVCRARFFAGMRSPPPAASAAASRRCWLAPASPSRR